MNVGHSKNSRLLRMNRDNRVIGRNEPPRPSVLDSCFSSMFFRQGIETMWHDVFDRALFTLQTGLVVAHITCQAPKVWVNNMSVDDYHLRHLQGSCCNWLSPPLPAVPFKTTRLSSASAATLLHAQSTRTETHTQIGSQISVIVQTVNHVLEDIPTLKVAHKGDVDRDRQGRHFSQVLCTERENVVK